MKLADIPELQALPIEDKLQRVEELWVDVARDLDTLEVSSEQREVLDERWASFLRDPSRPLTIEQFQERLKAVRR